MPDADAEQSIEARAENIGLEINADPDAFAECLQGIASSMYSADKANKPLVDALLKVAQCSTLIAEYAE